MVSNVDFCYKEDLKILTSPIDDISTPQTVWAKQIIASNKIIAPVQNVEYLASKDISLKVGFHAQNASGFHAVITPCFDVISAFRYMAQKRVSEENTLPETIKSDDHFTIFPNPTKDEAHIKFRLENASKIKISVYDASGKIIFTDQSNEAFPKGEFLKTIDVSGYATGVYLVSFECDNFKEAKKLIKK